MKREIEFGVAIAALVGLMGCGGGGSGGGEAPGGTPAAPSPAPSPSPGPPPSSVPPVAATPLSPLCAAYYGTAPLALTSARTLLPIPNNAKPAKGAVDPQSTFHTCVVRATDHAADGVAGAARNAYSRRQAFNVDSTRQLVLATDGYFHIYDATTHAHLARLPSFGVDPEPQWHPSDPNLLYVMPRQGAGLKLQQVDIRNGAVSDVKDFGPQLRAIWPNAGLANTRDEGSPSADGRYWCFMVRDSSRYVNGSWPHLGVFTWDMAENRILSSMPLPDETPDHVSMSPKGNYCVVSSDGPTGTTAFLASDFSNTARRLRLQANSTHSDLALAADGREVYVSSSSQNQEPVYRADGRTVDHYKLPDGRMFFTYLDSGERVTLIDDVYKQPTYIGAVHFSGKAFNKPGWVLLDTDADANEPGGGATGPLTGWMQRKIMAVQLRADPAIHSLAFSRSRYIDGGTAPVASVNRDFTRIAFNSNWGVNTTTDIDVYNIELPPDALK